MFFALGAIWSIIGVLLWPLFYLGWLSYHPLYSHARIMIEGFGGAFVIGFLGTAGPRMSSAPKLKPIELLLLICLHTGAAVLHLRGDHRTGDFIFAVLLVSLLAALLVRVLRFAKEPPPPQMLLALAGLCMGIIGSVMFVMAPYLTDPRVYRLASLSLYQGFLLPPVLGIGSFIFPRILGGSFGEPGTERESQIKRLRTLLAIVLLIISFIIDAYVSSMIGGLLRASICLIYLLMEVSWSKRAEQGTLAGALKISCILGLAGLVLASFVSPWQRIAVEHLLYIGGFGLLMLIVGSRVLFGHSGRLAEFSKRSWMARIIVGLAILACITRVVPAFAPRVTISHHQYAAITWAVMMSIWLAWQSRHFFEQEKEGAVEKKKDQR